MEKYKDSEDYGTRRGNEISMNIGFKKLQLGKRAEYLKENKNKVAV